MVEDDHMNLDDFIVPSSIGTPAGVSPAAPSHPIDDEDIVSGRRGVSAIPIKQQQRIQAEELQISRASAPSAAAYEQARVTHEFDYVPRHVRKTSIDERGVRLCLTFAMCHADMHRIANAQQKHRHKYRPSGTVTPLRITQRTTSRYITTR